MTSGESGGKHIYYVKEQFCTFHTYTPKISQKYVSYFVKYATKDPKNND